MRPREEHGRLSRSDRLEIRERIRAGQTHAEIASGIAAHIDGMPETM